jgi:hypothetical protein
MPRDRDGEPIAPSDYNRSDGFSPGQIIVTRVPGLDTLAAFRRTGAVPLTDMGRYRARRAPIVVIDARTGRRHPIWAELDMRAPRRSRALLIHPSLSWREGHRYVVALRRLRDARGRLLHPRRAFRIYRDRRRSRSPDVERRRRHLESVFRILRRAGIRRRDLYLAWDFTVASRRSLSQRLLSIRNRAFASLGDRRLGDLRVAGRPPAFRVDRVELAGGVRRVFGRFTVPCYLNRPGCPPGARFRPDRRGLPTRLPHNTMSARFICLVPGSGSSAAPGRALLFGHGLFGSARDVLALGPLVNLFRIVACATDWSGMSSDDVPNALVVSRDLSRFPSIPDRTQQGLLNFMFLGRLMLHPAGLASNPAFRDGGGPVIDTRRVVYAGASLGGILGGALTAVAPDFTRAALIVPGMNFSLLVTRSADFDRFYSVIARFYRRPLERALILSMVQILWDRGEANAYAWHITRAPYRDTPRHTVLLHEAFGDHQVANVATETEARTLGARLRRPALDPGRSRDRAPFWGIRPIPAYPFGGNALVVYDIGPLRTAGGSVLGTPPAPTTNTVPRIGVDPHAVTAFEPTAALQFSAFLAPGGAFVDVCGSSPCRAAGWTGP